MASSDDFRAKLKAGNITEALTLALTEAARLKITTQVISGVEDGAENQAQPGNRLQTQINAIEGAIENEIGDKFLGNGPYRELLQFHQEQVAQSHLLIQHNLQSLQKLFDVLIALRHPSVPQTITEPLFPEDKEKLLPSSSVVTPELVILPQESFTPEISTIADIPEADISGGGWEFKESESFQEEISHISDIPAIDMATEWRVDEPESVTGEIAPLPEMAAADISAGWRVDEPESVTGEIAPLPDMAAADITQKIEFEQPEYFPEEIPATPLTSNEDIDRGGWATDSQEFVVEEDVPPEAKHPNRQEILNKQREEDDAVLDLLISLPTPPLPSQEGLDIQLEDGEWGEFLDEENLHIEPEGAESDLEEGDWAILSEDWGNLDLEEVDEASGTSGLSVDPLDFQIEPEAPQIEFTQDHPISRLESLELATNKEEEDEWDDWVVDEPQIRQKLSPLDVPESQEWGDLMTDFDPFAEAPSIQELPADVDIGEDWDEFAVDELEPYSETIEVDSGFDLSDLLEDISTPPSNIYGSQNIDLRHNKEDDPLDKLDLFSAKFDETPEVSSDMMDLFFEETQSKANRQGGGKEDEPSIANRQESLFDDMSFEEFSMSVDDSEIELSAEDFGQLSETEEDEEDWDEDTSDIGKREPPPSPPSYFFKPKNK
ncbi:MAG TPA: hypothetical protein DEG17_11765 [Cyanobacteria bacterium UBA11149]|nr:hypothetical protein [Cyanobacteria bacterium UBA11367]HBE59779.1 hypothetical protein [Cyanobacteria bacterium UBA11366]HBK64265.1 hypothetical protein [Cyanobacteria bacterium UBA11166]HBR72353.1 hypothetical protein [Cyanobacteria bacterium UBA11159]HBS70862.1 hypothetical protein [Cyanobacteria bacterium UBA11153]HBW89522.1 hypothetical protein [Cyanobacteria bacterium UBA11149]HCA94938.1 hypothetical protein [Cyanobacteria bacterium UBA9226]